ncbi:MAG TPA: hypothetical protein VK886_04760, partial [Vicinamibacterales bacterium]|nr:hypothetical protein [Vicinamibacterales bacterium]
MPPELLGRHVAEWGIGNLVIWQFGDSMWRFGDLVILRLAVRHAPQLTHQITKLPNYQISKSANQQITKSGNR